MKQSKLMICRMKQKVQQTKQLFFSIWLNDNFMFSYEFLKTVNLYSYKSLKELKSLKISHEISVNLHNPFQKFDIFNKDSQFIKKSINESFNFFSIEHRIIERLYTSLNHQRLLLEHFQIESNSHCWDDWQSLNVG